MLNPNSTHPGQYVRADVIPAGMSVTRAAKIMGVGRPALSNFLNGKADLSRQMAARLERAFKADADDLMKRQTAYRAAHQTDKRSVAAEAVKHVPPFLEATANDIQNWAETHEARELLAVLLRMLVNSTCGGLELVDFPGRDDAERPGWDGRIETNEGNPWVPEGKSGWEFGTNQQIARKATEDYGKRTEKTAAGERQKTTFVFVTPRRWPGKDNWLEKKNAEGQWRRVQAFDASNLEQWLEQSIPSQTWFAERRRLNLRGVKSLDRCWNEWCADCEPPFSEEIFAQAISTHKEAILSHLRSKNGGILPVVADSRPEGLAFLSALLTQSDPDLRAYRDKVAVFTEQGPLSKLAVGSPDFIPVITSPDIGEELAESRCALTGFVIRHLPPKEKHDPAIILDPLTTEAFKKGLTEMGLEREDIEHLDRESGGSLTVLRRRLASSEEIQSPKWSADEELARPLVPMMLAGAWDKDKDADRGLMTELAGYECYESLERDFMRMLNLEDSPVWCEGDLRGVVSKTDSLFGVQQWVTEQDFDRFMDVAERVLSERDPALDLPKEERWAATLCHKERKASSPLRDGIAESLVSLSIHGNLLFGRRFGEQPTSKVSYLVQKLLEPLSEDNLLSQSSYLPFYAEAAPEVFLDMLEHDLSLEKPAIEVLMHPIKDFFFQRSDRVGLLWALELLAWNPGRLARVVKLLARLTELEPSDNLMAKPSESLQHIFQSRMPQTAAAVEQRTKVFDCLVESHPNVAWRIAISQFRPRRGGGWYSRKPRRRDSARGFGGLVPEDERKAFVIHCIETCFAWRSHTLETLSDLMKCAEAEALDSHYLKQLVDSIARWAKHAEEEERTRLCEQVRDSMELMRRMFRAKQTDASTDVRILAAQKALDLLEPTDLIWKHAWLFKNSWVEASRNGLHDDMGCEARENQVQKLRDKAVREVASRENYKGLLQLAFSGNAAYWVGRSMAKASNDEEEVRGFIHAAIRDGDILKSRKHQSLISGILLGVGEERAMNFVQELWEEHGTDIGAQLLCQCRFSRPIWSKADSIGKEVADKYWADVQPFWENPTAEDMNFGISRLLGTGRLMTALNYASLEWKLVQSEHIRSALVKLPPSAELVHGVTSSNAYTIKQALKVLDARKVFSQAELAQLEFLYLDLFWLQTTELPNLEREIEANPYFFCEAVALVWEGENAREELSEEKRPATRLAHRLLHKVKRIPGHEDGALKAERLTAWVRKVQEICRMKDWQQSGDKHIGVLLANAPVGDDGVWPCEAVRETLEEVLNKNMQIGFEMGRLNLRGIQCRSGDGGAQERELAAKYEGWAKACEISYPKVATALRRIVSTYDSEARWHDRESAVQRRLGY